MPLLKNCSKCFKSISPNNIAKHERSCSGGIPKTRLRFIERETNIFACLFCKKLCKNRRAFQTHCETCKDNPHRRLTSFSDVSKRSKIIEEKVFLNQYTKARLLGRAAPTLSEITRQKLRTSSLGRRHSEETKAKLSAIAKARKIGGYKLKGHRKSKSGSFQGIWCDSQWELAYLIYCLDHGINVKRNTSKFKYFWEQGLHDYTPDFLVEGQYVEIKGYHTPLVDAKTSVVPGIKVLYKKDLDNVFAYIREKYYLSYKEVYKLYDTK